MALFLKHKLTGELYPYNALMEKRGDMLRVEVEDAPAVEPPPELKKRGRPAKIDAMAADVLEVGNPE